MYKNKVADQLRADMCLFFTNIQKVSFLVMRLIVNLIAQIGRFFILIYICYFSGFHTGNKW